MKKVYLIVAGALLFLLAACVPGATPTVRTQLPKPINFQVTEVDGGYHASWTYIADLAGVSAFNLYREETLQNGTRLGAEDRVFRITWGACEDAMCLTITDGDVDEAEAQPISVGTLECTATGCYFGYTDTAGLNSTSTYRYYLRMVNADGVEDNQIIVVEEERLTQEPAEEVGGEVPSQPSERDSDEGNGEPGRVDAPGNGDDPADEGESGENSKPGNEAGSEEGGEEGSSSGDDWSYPGDGIACGDDLLECDDEEGSNSGDDWSYPGDGIACGDDLLECDNEGEFQVPTTLRRCLDIGWDWKDGVCQEPTGLGGKKPK